MSLEKINNRSPEAHLGLRAASVALFVLQTTALGQASELRGKNGRVGGCGPTAGSISKVGSQLGPDHNSSDKQSRSLFALYVRCRPKVGFPVLCTACRAFPLWRKWASSSSAIRVQIERRQVCPDLSRGSADVE
jgi:hypothetical protein